MSEYVVVPEGEGRYPAVVIVHEWWGANEQIRATADRWASAGFVACVPDLYDGKVVPIGRSDEASAAMNALDFERAVKTISTAIKSMTSHPRSSGSVVLTGYCMGGALTFATATQVAGLAAAIPFYGLPPKADWSKIDAPIQAHFAEHDTWATVAGAKHIQDTLKQQHKAMELHVYDAQHAFCNDRRPDVYNPQAAQQAWERSVAFARAHTT